LNLGWWLTGRQSKGWSIETVYSGSLVFLSVLKKGKLILGQTAISFWYIYWYTAQPIWWSLWPLPSWAWL